MACISKGKPFERHAAERQRTVKNALESVSEKACDYQPRGSCSGLDLLLGLWARSGRCSAAWRRRSAGSVIWLRDIRSLIFNVCADAFLSGGKWALE